jgi:hypothetical protein
MSESTITRRVGGGLELQEALKSFSVASGQTITAGTFVDYLQGNNIGFGSQSQFNDPTYDISITAFGTNRVVVAYRDNNNANRGTARVGTISGTTISWGSEFVFNTVITSYTSITAFGTDKIVIAYTDGNSYTGTAIVGTISGTTISWGSASVFSTSNTADRISITAFGTDRVVVAYRNNGNSGRGTSIVGTISGTTISWGSASVFNTSTSGTSDISITAFGTDRVVVAYKNVGDSSRGTAIVGTISGTTISWGSASVFSTATTTFIYITNFETDRIIITFSGSNDSGYARVGTISETTISWGSASVFSTNQTSNISHTVFGDKVIVSYRNRGNSNRGTAIVGTISGTTISWGSAFIFNDVWTEDIGITAFGTDKIVIAYRSVGFNGWGYAIVGTIPQLITNTTAEKFFGLAKTGGTAGQTIEVFVNT